MTEFFPSPVAGNAFPLIPPPPNSPAFIGIPPGITILQAMAIGALPAQTQVTGFGTGAANPTIMQLVSSGLVQLSALASSLTYASPSCNYGGN
jgi:hypothetical protein